jgi:hypothetical protein
MKIVRSLLWLCVLGCGSFAQQQKIAGTAATGGKVNPKLHADVLTLVELEDTKARMQAGITPALESGKAEIAKSCPNCKPVFAEEWYTRMQARIKVDDFVAVAVRAYEKYFNDAEVKELIAYGRAKKANQNPEISAALQQKLSDVMPSLGSDIMSGCTQISARLGALVGEEIGKEHPEYLKGRENTAK